MTLNATPLQMGKLGTVQYLPWLLVGLVAGAWVDRLRRRPVMIAADLGRTLLLGLIPLAAVAGVLRLEHLYLVGFLVGILNVFFDVAYAAYLPTLVPRDRLTEGNSKLQVSASIAEISGPGLAGGLVQLVTAPLAIALDALSFLASAFSLAWIREPEPKPAPVGGSRSMLAEICEGLRLVFSNPILPRLCARQRDDELLPRSAAVGARSSSSASSKWPACSSTATSSTGERDDRAAAGCGPT